MEPSAQKPRQERFINASGLPEEAIQALESLVAPLRGQANGKPAYRSHEEWSKAFHEWVQGHRTPEVLADDSRESIYAGRGE
jgi:hypothetical protein